jgi:D-alanyl-D-alanine carboxypeptidase
VTLQALLDEIPAFGAVAEVHHAGRRVWRGTTGPVPAGAKFRAGSITKSFVATVVLQLAGEGRLALDEVRPMLQHTSGIPDYGSSERFRRLYGGTEAIVGLRHRTWTRSELLDLVAGEPPLFPPGSSWAYSSTNYLRLGLVIERVTGRPYAAEASRRILRPLGLRDTSFPGTETRIDGPHLRGYLDDGVDITEFDQSFAGAAGEIVSSTADLNRFYRALMTGELLAPAGLAAMRTVLPSGDYGLGVARRQLPGGTTLWGHNGGTFGFETFSWSTAAGDRQVTVATAPRPGHDPQPRADEFLAAAFG